MGGTGGPSEPGTASVPGPDPTGGSSRDSRRCPARWGLPGGGGQVYKELGLGGRGEPGKQPAGRYRLEGTAALPRLAGTRGNCPTLQPSPRRSERLGLALRRWPTWISWWRRPAWSGGGAIITHPPHGRESLPLLADLAAFAAHALQPSGSLVVLSGMEQLPETLERLKHPDLHWVAEFDYRDNGTTTWSRPPAPDPAAAQVIADLRETGLPAPAGGRRH